MSVRRLFFDIETSPCVGWFWRPGYNLNLDYNNILENAKIICICYKWEGDKKTYSLSWDSKQNDKKMLQDFIKVLNQANEIIGHNSDKFDIKWIRTRCLIHGVDMIPEYTSIDTLNAAGRSTPLPIVGPASSLKKSVFGLMPSVEPYSPINPVGITPE